MEQYHSERLPDLMHLKMQKADKCVHPSGYLNLCIYLEMMFKYPEGSTIKITDEDENEYENNSKEEKVKPKIISKNRVLLAELSVLLGKYSNIKNSKIIGSIINELNGLEKVLYLQN